MRRKNSNDNEYRERTDTAPSKQTSDKNDRTNNTAVSTPGAAPNVGQASNEGLGDAAVNDEKMTKFNSNRSADA